MKLESDLVRAVLLAIEASDHDPFEWIGDLNIEGYTKKLVSYHVQLLDEAGFIEAVDLSTIGEYYWAPKRLTYRGHEFLNGIRDPKAWSFAKDVAKRAGTKTLEFLFDAAKAYAKSEFKRITGFDM